MWGRHKFFHPSQNFGSRSNCPFQVGDLKGHCEVAKSAIIRLKWKKLASFKITHFSTALILNLMALLSSYLYYTPPLNSHKYQPRPALRRKHCENLPFHQSNPSTCTPSTSTLAFSLQKEKRKTPACPNYIILRIHPANQEFRTPSNADQGLPCMMSL